MTADSILLLASTVAAATAAFYANRAVNDARTFHREQERDGEQARLLTIAGTLAELASVAYTVGGISGERSRGALRAQLARFKAAVETTAKPIPLCRALATRELADDRYSSQLGTDIHKQAGAAADELREAIKHLA